MKRLHNIIIVSLLALIFVSSDLFAKTDYEFTKLNFWGRAAIQAPLTQNGLGLFAMYSHRYNQDVEKKADGTEVDQDKYETYLQEFFFGPTFTTKLAKRLKYNGKMMYRGQYWYGSEAGGMKSFYRHTIDWHNNLFYNLGPLKLHLRVILWDLMEVEDKDAGVDYDNEIWNRNMLGVIIPINKTFSVLLEDEVFFNLMPYQKSSPGMSNFFFRNAIWAGVDIKPAKVFKLSLKYVWYHSMGENSLMKKTIDDHYIFAQVTYIANFRE